MVLTLVYITNPSREKAEELARHLLEKRLIGCANIFPIGSIYRWKGKLTEEKEFVLLAKTTEKNFNKVKGEVENIHPYDVPCIMRIPAEVNEKYLKWLEGEIKE